MAARKPRSQAKRSAPAHKRGIPGWLWLVAGLLIGLLLALALLIHDGFDAKRLLPRPNPEAPAPREPEPPVAQQASKPNKPKYDFYTVLPGREVVIPDAEVSAKAKEEPSQSVAEPSEKLLLQAGAFSDAQRAEEIKAAIAFTGLVARVEPTTTRSGSTVHRVMLGPYASLRELDQAKSTLSEAGVQAIAIRQPNPPKTP